ncbi:ABC transporter ATP-binding protein [Microbacterium terricola]|uniref:Spermidine/putrescine import ATP-binding protein PotA n=1 Tax=Microbacterium terricola TaxID=344163 RepID=A0ABM8E1L4_9MICO|nr:ABC transporter ATP-binding protein [Microbacterium terricola]UYK40447.1 ABC transporter ATP-binding protein [Microbacterium terricola]BDV31833.1 polyamine-transporting ATPase [Microbacterium terricola]
MTAADTTTERAGADSGTRGSVVLAGVTKRYGDQVAVDDLSLQIEQGEFLSLLGPSGCGKTTTLRMIAGFEHPDAGDILISGASVLGAPPHKRDVNTVFQAYALFPHMSVAENVAYGLQQRRVPKAEVRERVSTALDMVQMRRFADRKPTQLSGGQQQRVALARALVNRPSVLLLDEPLGALDRQLREEMQLELKLLQSRLGITFVFVTHDQGEALSMSDRIAVMRDGRIEQLADSDTIYGSPASAYVAAFVGQQNFFDGTVAADAASVATPHVLVRPASPITSPAPGAPARAAVRPEFVELATTRPDTDANAAEGRIIGLSHLGETMQFLVQLDAEQAVLSRRPTPDAPRVAVGDSVWCSWRPESVQVFPHDDLAAAAGHVDPPTTRTVRTAQSL